MGYYCSETDAPTDWDTADARGRYCQGMLTINVNVAKGRLKLTIKKEEEGERGYASVPLTLPWPAPPWCYRGRLLGTICMFDMAGYFARCAWNGSWRLQVPSSSEIQHARPEYIPLSREAQLDKGDWTWKPPLTPNLFCEECEGPHTQRHLSWEVERVKGFNSRILP